MLFDYKQSRLSKFFGHLIATGCYFLTFVSCLNAQVLDGANDTSGAVQEVHQSGMLWDGHNDLPWAMRQRGGSSFDQVDIAKPTQFHTDIARLKKGGVKAQFWSVYVPAGTDRTGNALLQTLEQIDLVHRMCKRYPDVFELALTAGDVERITREGRIASLIGVEGGHSIQNSLQVLRELYDRGARYMTLTHSRTLAWADSATDDPKNGGLSPFGKEVVREMNRLGMLVDLSHVSAKCMKDALEVTKAPVIFSHSSARAINDHARNVPDDVLRLTAENGGVVMVTFVSGYTVPTAIRESDKQARGSVNTICDHIEHVIKVAGIDHVGLGGDYDGVSRLPVGLEDVSCYPKITKELMARGYSKGDIHKLLGANVLRVLKQAEQVSSQLKASPGLANDGAALRITIPPALQDRKHVIAKAMVAADSVTVDYVTLRDKQGNTCIGQISLPSIHDIESAKSMKEVTFIVPEIAKGETKQFSVFEKGLVPHLPFEWHDDAYGTAELQCGGQSVMAYKYEPLDDSTGERRQETYKVFHHVYSPSGDRLITKGPGGLFPHHRGLFYGFNIIKYGNGNRADVWHCKQKACQTHEKSVAQIAGPVFGRDVNLINWRGSEGNPVATELREMTAYKIAGRTLIDFRSTLSPVAGPLQLRGDPQHAGFQFRAAQVIPDKTKSKTFYIRPDGKDQAGRFRNWSDKEDESAVNQGHINLPFNAACFTFPEMNISDERKLDELLLTVCYLDHPDNPKPARYSERDYGRFGSYFEFDLTENNPLRLRYRIWIEEGEMDVEQIKQLQKLFVQPPVATTAQQ